MALGIGIAILLVQIVDIAIHVATNQIEPIRIAASAIVVVWVALTMSQRIASRRQLVGAGVIGIYLLMNIVFLFLEGFTNNGDPFVGSAHGKRYNVNVS